MGFGPFGSKTVVAVSAATHQLNKDLPEDRFNNVIFSAISRKTDLSKAISYYQLTGFSSKLRSYYDYAVGNYPTGLPTTNIRNDTYKNTELASVLSSIEGEAVKVIESFLYAPDVNVWGKWWLQENEPTYNYTNHTLEINRVTWNVDSFTPVLNKVTAQFNDITVGLISGNISGSYGKIGTYPPTNIHIIAEYSLVSNPAVKKIWIYDPTLNTYPELTTNEAVDTKGIYPAIPIRYNDRNINEDKDSDEYKASKELFRKITLDFDDITQALTYTQDARGDYQPIPDLHLISDIYFIIGVNVYGEDQGTKELLYRFFQGIKSLGRTTKTIYDNIISTNQNPISRNNLYINAGNLDMDITYNYIDETTETGQIGAIGEYETQFIITNNIGHSYSDGIENQSQSIPVSQLKIQLQTAYNTYQEITVHGLTIGHAINTVKGVRFATFKLSGYTPGQDISDDQKNFVIPLTRTIVEGLTIRESDKVLPISNHIIFYASDSQKISAWENFVGSILAPVLQIVAIVLFVVSLGKAKSFTDFLYILGKTLATKYAIEYVLKQLFLEAGDNDAAQALIAIAAVAITYKFSIEGTDLTTAETALKVTNVLSTVSFTRSSAMYELEMDIHEPFMEDLKEVQAELDEIHKQLEVRSSLDLTAIYADRQEIYEEPDEFFERTLNPNPGLVVFDQIPNYVDNALNLDLLKYRQI